MKSKLKVLEEEKEELAKQLEAKELELEKEKVNEQHKIELNKIFFKFSRRLYL